MELDGISIFIYTCIYRLVNQQFTIEHGLLTVDLPIKDGDFA